MPKFLLIFSQWIRERASARALRIGRERMNDFLTFHPNLLEMAKAEGKVIGYYINAKGKVATNFHLFGSSHEAVEWAVKPPASGAQHAIAYPHDFI